MPNVLRAITDITRCGIQYRSHSLAPLGLKAVHSSYLMTICREPGISQEQLSRQICIDKSNVARQAAVLEENGFITRCPSSQDKRVMQLYPTEKTLELLPQIRAVLLQWRQVLTQDLSDEEQLLMERLLQKMRQRATEYIEVL